MYSYNLKNDIYNLNNSIENRFNFKNSILKKKILILISMRMHVRLVKDSKQLVRHKHETYFFFQNEITGYFFNYIFLKEKVFFN